MSREDEPYPLENYMPEVKQKYADPRHVPFYDDCAGWACDLVAEEYGKLVAKCECTACLELFMQLGRWAETRYYAM